MIPDMVDLPTLAALTCCTEAEVEAMVAAGEIPPPRAGKWKWAHVDAALTGDGETWIYFIQAGEFIKIGRADDVRSRMLDLQVSCPLELNLLHKMRAPGHVEKTLHRKFRHLKVRSEWGSVSV